MDFNEKNGRDPLPVTLYLLRHGQTAFSRENRFCGCGSDPDLTAEGAEMARAFAEAYRAIDWTAIYASPLKRAIETASPLCQTIRREPELRGGLQEIGYGAWEGMSVRSVKDGFPEDYEKWLLDPAWNAPTGGETAVDVASRSMLVLREIQKRYESAEGAANVLVVSHKATIRILLCDLLGMDISVFRHRLDCPVGSVCAVELTAQGPLLRSLADRSHLSDRLKRLPGT